MTDEPTTLAEALAEIRRLRERIGDLETELMLSRGTLAEPATPDAPIHIDYDIPPNAPR